MGPAHCAECHTGNVKEDQVSFSPQDPAGAGRRIPFPLGPLGTLYSKNLTPDPQTGLGRYSDPQIARMLRHGVRPNGLASIPPLMPYGDMSDDDIVAIDLLPAHAAGGAARRARQRVDTAGQRS